MRRPTTLASLLLVAAATTILVLPGAAGAAIAIRGVGPGRPSLTAPAGATVLELSNGSLEGVDVRSGGGVGIEAGGAQLRDVRVSGGTTGIRALGDVDATDLRADGSGTGVSVQDAATVRLAGARIAARDAGVSSRGTAFVSRSLVQTTAANAVGIAASGGGMTLDHVTLAGQGVSALDFHLVDIEGRANVSAVALAGYDRGIVRDTSETGGSYPVAIRDSVWDASRDLGGPFDESGDAHVAPALTAALHPRGSSAQVDRDSRPDARYVDLDGLAPLGRADAGAFEYLRRAPSIDAVSAPGAGASGSALAFSATASDPDVDALQLAWTFGDGSVGTGERTAHAYAAPGINTAALLVTDEAGLTATRSFTVAVTGTPAGPAPAPAAPAPAIPAPAPDRAAPRVTAVKLSAGRLRLTLSEPATVRITTRGRTIVRRLGSGRHSIRVKARAVKVTATDAAGNRSAARRVQA